MLPTVSKVSVDKLELIPYNLNTKKLKTIDKTKSKIDKSILGNY